MRGRGIERRPIFLDDDDREDFLERLGRLVDRNALTVYAWALMTNHFHLLVRTGAVPLERAMRSLLAGYATRFNRRHERAGHLFQNRYKSTLCEDEPYFLKLVQYIHLNPVPSVVPHLAALADYAYTGHSVLLGRTTRVWQDTETVLGRFAESPAAARLLYEEFMGQGALGARPELEGGGIVRGASGYVHVRKLRKGRERFSSDERVLATRRFVDRTLEELREPPGVRLTQEELINLVCDALGIARELLAAEGRPRAASRARRGIAYLWTVRLGGSGRAIAARLGLSPASVYEAANRGGEEADYWAAVLQRDAAKPDKP
ncbi:MAG: transposase [Candidatus Binatia bacterium]